jgi:hypothetical protein
MIIFGIVLMILGAGSFVLPKYGMQFILLSFFGNATPIVAIVLMSLGAIMTIFGIVGAIRDKINE